MKLINQKAELLIQQPGLKGIYKQIELAGRTCYKSEDKITEDSAEGFVDRMIKSNHLAMLEHGTVYLWNPVDSIDFNNIKAKYSANKYSSVNREGQAITTNYRVLIENGWKDDLQILCEPTEFHEKRCTFKVTTSIGVTRELNRHRTFSIAEQSTRYCNYSKDKFENGVTFCIPEWYDKRGFVNSDDTVKMPVDYTIFINALIYAESSYMYLIEKGLQPQQAREVLPLCTATEAVYTAFESDWKHFFDLRYFETTGKVHPNMKELSTIMYELWHSRTLN